MEPNEYPKIMKTLVLQWIFGPKGTKKVPNKVSGQPGPSVFLTGPENVFLTGQTKTDSRVGSAARERLGCRVRPTERVHDPPEDARRRDARSPARFANLCGTNLTVIVYSDPQ